MDMILMTQTTHLTSKLATQHSHEPWIDDEEITIVKQRSENWRLDTIRSCEDTIEPTRHRCDDRYHSLDHLISQRIFLINSQRISIRIESINRLMVRIVFGDQAFEDIKCSSRLDPTVDKKCRMWHTKSLLISLLLFNRFTQVIYYQHKPSRCKHSLSDHTLSRYITTSLPRIVSNTRSKTNNELSATAEHSSSTQESLRVVHRKINTSSETNRQTTLSIEIRSISLSIPQISKDCIIVSSTI